MTKVNIGLDIGTGNTGYAVTDESYNIVSVKGKKALGVLGYEEAKTAEARRTKRTARRRLERRKFRITLLQEIFNDEIMKKDNNFIRRLNENDLHLEDKEIKDKYSLFNDQKYNDKKYYKQFPTIYHLRKFLMDEGTDDIRLIYLAVHHIIKYRGHFLVDGEFNECKDSLQYFEELNSFLEYRKEEVVDMDMEEAKINVISTLDLSNLNDLYDLISGKGEITKKLSEELQEKSSSSGKHYKKIIISKKDKKQKAYELLNAKTPSQRSVVNIIFGDKVNISSLFGNDAYSKDEVKGFYMSDDFDSVEDLSLIKDNQYDYSIILVLKKLYDWYILTDLLKGEENLSQAMINIYEAHKNDLNMLKFVIKTFAPDEYNNVFGEPAKDCYNYSAYIGGGRMGSEKIGSNGRLGKTATYEEFKKYLKGILEKIKDEQAEPLVQEILSSLDNGEFLPKIVSKNNSAIPYQINELELKKILDKAVYDGNFDFLNCQSDGMTNYQKIVSLLTFRIPYYVGPVKHYKDGEDASKNAWAIRKEEGRVTPWTFHSRIDSEKCNEVFIKRMTNKCTYLKKANTLPKNSIIFSKFAALNELNKLKINGEEIPVELKKEIFDNVYMSRKPTIKNIASYVKTTNYYDEEIKITGYDTEIKGNMNSYLAYKKVLGEKVDNHPNMIERMIFLSTIHTDSKMIESSITKEFGKYLTTEEIGKLKSFKFSGWGSLSQEFLAGSTIQGGLKLMDNLGEYWDTVDIMYETNQNLQQILNNELYNFAEALEKYNQENDIILSEKISYEDVENMYCSPSVKKTVWQAFGLVKDILKQTKATPSKIFIEVTRTNTDKQKKKRTKTRKEKIQDSYNEARKVVAEYTKKNRKGSSDWDKAQLENLVESLPMYEKELQSKSDSELNSEKLYLYFMQRGKCMYTGNDISIDELFTGNNYDVDHIIPRAHVKDDSLDNKVLVSQKINKDKTNEYPIPKDFRQVGLWKTLHSAKLISDEKYARLVRTSDITAEEQDKFINRQLVETNQTATCLRELLEHYFAVNYQNKVEKVEIVLSRANNVSMFRKLYGLTKSRDVNDFHHAFDAYYNIVVGDILNKEYNHNWKKFYARKNIDFAGSKDKSYNFETTIKIAMASNSKALLNHVITQTDTEDVQITKKLETGKGELYGATLFKADSSKDTKLYPQQSSKIVDGKETNPKSDVAKYGGYKTSGTAYFVVVDSIGKKGEQKRTIESISIFHDKMLQLGKTSYKEIFEERGLKNAKVAKIDYLKSGVLKAGSLLDFGNYKLRLAGATGNQLSFHNANQLLVNNETNDYIKEISMVIEKANKKCRFISDINEKQKSLNDFVIEYNQQGLERTQQKNQTSKIVLLTENDNIKIYDLFIEKLSKHPYKDIPTYDSLLCILTNARNNFLSMKIYEQICTLMNLIVAFQCNAQKVDASKLWYEVNENDKIIIKKGGTKQCAIIKNKDITNERVSFISQSKSGLKCNIIDLKQNFGKD